MGAANGADLEWLRSTVPERVVARQREQAPSPATAYDLVVDTLYHERLRLEQKLAGGRRASKAAHAERAFYRRLTAKLERVAVGGEWALVLELARHFVEQTVAPSSERAYRLATFVAPRLLAVGLDLAHPSRLLKLEGLAHGLSRNLGIAGEVELVRRLARRGTLVVVPTHVSNLDPMVTGYAFSLLGLQRFLFGGSAHLFVNPVVSFFLHTLGAYRVDRQRRALLYKDVLKQYAACTLECGQHNIFFPGGTRSRNGEVERRLKKGLLGTALQAYIGNLRHGHPTPEIYVVPCTIGYKLVLEAETLIDDHLQEAGKSRYIIDDDEFTRPTRVATFLSRLVGHGGKILFRIGPPLDPFGNAVDEDGRSLDARGRHVDPSAYVRRDGRPVYDVQRDRAYTDELAEVIAGVYRRETVIMSTHVVARALFDMLRRQNPGLGLYRLLQTGGIGLSFTVRDMYEETERVVAALRARSAAGPQLGPDLVGTSTEAILDDALYQYRIYHRRPPAQRRGDRVFHENRNLILYYANRTGPVG